MYTYQYPKADVTTDIVVFGIDFEQQQLKVLLIERGKESEPFFGCWALPGGFINLDERLGDTAARELREETGLTLSYIEQLYTFGKPDRDPRGRVISVAYMGLVRPDAVKLTAGDDARKVAWFPVCALPKLAFDHDEIIDMALRRIRGKLRWQPVGVDLLPEVFTLREFQVVYEIILGKPVDKRNFRRRVLSFGVLEQVDKVARTAETGVCPQGYRFNQDAYDRLRRDGLDFEV